MSSLPPSHECYNTCKEIKVAVPSTNSSQAAFESLELKRKTDCNMCTSKCDQILEESQQDPIEKLGKPVPLPIQVLATPTETFTNMLNNDYKVYKIILIIFCLVILIKYRKYVIKNINKLIKIIYKQIKI